jgi:hypothetical protein
MALLSVEDLSRELSVSEEFITDLIDRQVITPYGGRARLGEPRFSSQALPHLRSMMKTLNGGAQPTSSF